MIGYEMIMHYEKVKSKDMIENERKAKHIK